MSTLESNNNTPPLLRRAMQRLPLWCIPDTTKWGRRLYSLFVALTLTGAMSTPAHATTVWEKSKEIMNSVYIEVLGVSTIAAVVTAAIALLLMNFSKNGKTVDESRSWLKRIIITWAILNGLGFIMAYVTPLFEGGQYTPG